MASFHIHRLKDHLRPGFRSAPHVSGAAVVKPRDYEAGEVVEEASPYAAFLALRDSARPLEVGDLLEAADASLRICKFVGFEEAHWAQPEAPAAPDPQEAASPAP